MHAKACNAIHAITFAPLFFARAIPKAMDDDWRSRLREMIEKDPRSLRELSRAVGAGPNFVQQLLKSSRAPAFPRLMKVLSELGPTATFYVISGVVADREKQLRDALLANGVDPSRLDHAVTAVSGFIKKPSEEQSRSDQHRDQSEPASPRREPGTSGARVPQSSS